MSGIPTPAVLYNCCLKHGEPVWSRFRSLIVSGVRLHPDAGGDENECVPCPDAEALFWTVYGRAKDGDVEALTDAPTLAAALVIAGFHMARARVAGVPLDLEEWAVLSTPRAAPIEAADANLRRIYAIRYVHHLVVKHMHGPAIEALDALDDDGELHRAVHSALVGECSDEWFAEQQRVDSATIPGGPT